jgi:TRAP-type C4-dicarboxylate transport system substrate-binding protein
VNVHFMFRGMVRVCLLATVMYAAALLSAVAAQAHGVSLDIYHSLAEDSAFHSGFLVPWVRKVEQESGGRLRFHLHPATAGAGDAWYERVRDGNVDIVWMPVRSAPDRFPALAPFEFPFMVRRAQGASRALSEYVRINDLADRDFGEVHLLAVHVTTGSVLHWRNLATDSSMSEVSGRRVAATTIADMRMSEMMGATPMLGDQGQLASAVRDATTDAILLPWEQAGASGVDRLTRSHLEFGPHNSGLTSSVFVLAMNSSSYRGLSEDLRRVIDANSGADTASWIGRVMDEAAATTRKSAIERGDTVRQITADEMQRWRSAGKSILESWSKSREIAGMRTGPLLDSARKYLQTFDPAE